MDNTEITDDTLEQRAIKVAGTLAMHGPEMLSINDWEALADYAEGMIMELDPPVYLDLDDE